MTPMRSTACLLGLLVLLACPTAQAQDRDEQGAGIPLLPMVVGAGGVVLLGAGGLFALRASSATDDALTATEHATAAQRAEDARSFTTSANLLFLAGGALLTVGVAWLAVELTDDDGGGGTALLIGPGSLALRRPFD